MDAYRHHKPQRLDLMTHHTLKVVKKWKQNGGMVFLGLLIHTFMVHSAAAVDVSTIKSITNIRKGIAQGASNVPGFGPTDVRYPASFAGKWTVDQKVTSTTVNENISPQTYPRIIQRLRDLPSFQYERTYSNYDGNIVLDRGSSTSSLYKTLLGDKYARTNWAFDNPNVLSVETSDNIVMEERVTKRSQESSSSIKEISQSYSMEDSTMVGYSEYSRLSEESASDADRNRVIREPKVNGIRLLARYKFDNKGLNEQGEINEILGLERLYIYPGNSLDLGNDKPNVVIKSQVRMTRIP